MTPPVHRVELATYTVSIGRGLLDALGDVVREAAPAHRYAIVTDSSVGPIYADRAVRSLGDDRTRVFTIPAGEAHKTRDTWAMLTDAMLAAGYARDTTVVALGGGVVGDVAGFVAATFMRGVPFVQVPTSLLAMLDASIGGKTGVDTPAGKNLVGAFHQPAAVIADPNVLATLPPEHLRAGLAEAIKHGVIADADHFVAVADLAPSISAGTARHSAELIARSVAIKADVVRRDEREGGLRKVLNFGHTIGHAIELLSGYRMLHGEAVAAGMVLEARLAERLGIAEPGTADRVRQAVHRASLPSERPLEQRAEDVLVSTRTDKKVRGGVVEYALPARVGAMSGAERGWVTPVADDTVLEILG